MSKTFWLYKFSSKHISVYCQKKICSAPFLDAHELLCWSILKGNVCIFLYISVRKYLFQRRSIYLIGGGLEVGEGWRDWVHKKTVIKTRQNETVQKHFFFLKLMYFWIFPIAFYWLLASLQRLEICSSKDKGVFNYYVLTYGEGSPSKCELMKTGGRESSCQCKPSFIIFWKT